MSMKKKILNRNTCFIVVISLICCALLSMPGLYNSPYAREEERCLGRVTEADD